MVALMSADVGGTAAVFAELLRTWSAPAGPLIALVSALIVYLRGWQLARKTRAVELPAWRAGCFVGGVFALWIALASPIDALDDYLLTAHMIQHFILMSVAPPLIALGAPVVPMLRGLPKLVIHGFGPVFRAEWLRTVGRAVMHPVTAWIAMNVAYVTWHVPAMFDLTFQSERIHDFEHICFFATSLLFWWVVLEPWPARARWPQWTMVPYLLSADVVNTVVSATLAFAGKVLYAEYAEAPRICFLTPLKDQVAAGSEMWVLNSTVMLIPAVVIAMRELSPRWMSKPETAILHDPARG